jgi:hypothetical protein
MAMSRFSWLDSPRGWMAVAAIALLASCGGGGGSDTPAGGGGGGGGGGGTAIVDSFGQPVGSDAGIGDGDSGADGTAGEGAPIANGQIVITDATGRTVNATTNAQGYYRAKVTGFTAPFVVRVTTPGGKVYHSLNVRPIVRNGFITINLSGLTEKIAYDVARAGGASRASQLTPQMVNQGAITTSLQAIRNQFATVIRDAGLDPNTFDPIGVPFRADHTGYDKVLDNVQVTIGSDGSVITEPKPASGGLAGNWSYLITVNSGGQSGTVDAGPVPGSAVPTLAQLQSVDYFRQQFTEAYEGMTITGSGNTISVVGPHDNFTITINSFSASNYQGCGACGVGSTVTYNTVANYTIAGVISDQNVPPTALAANAQHRYTRLN